VSYVVKVRPGERIKLRDIDPGDTHGTTRDAAENQQPVLEARLTRFQETLYAAGHGSVLIVLQGLDTAGKDGTIKHVFTAFNPAGCRVESFKTPTQKEAAHDFLWRVHRVTPPMGMVSIFNRSHYEDVLVVRVHKLAPRDVWEKRFARINEFETLLAENDTKILKFFLYISNDEQRERLIARVQDPKKAWKLSVSDWSEHDLYDEYVKAYEDAIERCSTAVAPWHIVTADHKWFRNFAVARTIVDSLESEVSSWERELKERGEENLKAIEPELKRRNLVIEHHNKHGA
jgi:PPK2 family polyphosphate:nucleotide phosphotransferase